MNEQEQVLIAAYNDRELDAKGMQSAQELLAHSTRARAYLEELRHGDRLLRSVFDPILREEIPTGLLPRKPLQSRLRYLMPVALAASLAVLAVFVVRQMDSDQRLRDQLIEMRQAIAELRHQTLENTPSGTPASWTAPKGRMRAQVTPLKTYRTADNRFCREYEERIEDKKGLEVRRGIACREGKALWPDRPGSPSPGGRAIAPVTGKGVNL